MCADLKVSQLKSELGRYGIETKGLKKTQLVELLTFVKNSAVFNKDIQSSQPTQDNSNVPTEKACNSCVDFKINSRTAVGNRFTKSK